MIIQLLLYEMYKGKGKVNSIIGNICTIILAEVLHILIDLLEFPDSESFIKQTFFVDSAANNSDK